MFVFILPLFSILSKKCQSPKGVDVYDGVVVDDIVAGVFTCLPARTSTLKFRWLLPLCMPQNRNDEVPALPRCRKRLHPLSSGMLQSVVAVISS